MNEKVEADVEAKNRLRQEVYRRILAGKLSLRDHRVQSSPRNSPTHGLSLHQVETIEDISPDHVVNRNQHIQLGVEGSLDVAVLGRALIRVAERHEILRTNFVFDGERHRAVVREDADFAGDQLVVVEGGGEQDAAIQQILAKPFDIASDPLFRVVIDRRSSAGDRLILVVDHIIFDGWSFGILMRDLQAAYGAVVEPPAGNAPAWQFRDFVDEESRAYSSGELDDDQAYWSEQVRTLPSFVSMRPGAPRRSSPGSRRDHGKDFVAVPEAVQSAVAGCAQEHRISPFSVYLGAFSLLISAYCGALKFPVVSPTANRSWRRSQGVIGPLSHSVILGMEIEPQAAVLDLLASAQQAARLAIKHERFPWTSTAAFKQSDFKANFYLGLQNYPVPRLNLGGMALRTEQVHFGPSSFEIAIFVIDDEEGCRLEVIYDNDVVDLTRARLFIDQYWSLLQAICRDAHLPVRDILPDLGSDRLASAP